MLLSEVRAQTARHHQSQLATWGALARTLAVQRKVDAALRCLEAWRASCRHPVLSISGGKDSTLLLQLARQVDPAIPAYRADGPVPLSDREAHVRQLAAASSSGPWVIVPYTYDVAGVLARDVRYPAGLKQRTLLAAMRAAGADGIAMGLRAQESRGRAWNVRMRGERYRTREGLWICTPLARWSAEEVIGYLVATDRLPLNPVYERTYLLPELNYLRDGTWMPNQMSDARGYRAWLAYHYPEHLADYDAARIALTVER